MKLFIRSVILFMLINRVIAANHDSVMKPQLVFGVSATHNFSFKPVTYSCDYVSSGLMYEAFTQSYYWQPSFELLYNIHSVLRSNKEFSLSFGLRTRYETNYRVYDTTCSFQGSFQDKINLRQCETVFELPAYVNYKINSWSVRLGGSPALIKYKIEKQTDRNNISNRANSWEVNYGYFTMRLEYTLIFHKKREMIIFGYVNRIIPDEIGFGLGVPILYKNK